MAEKTIERLHPGEAIPFFDLPEAGGGRVRPWQYRDRRNLVLFFVHSAGCGPCRELLKQLNSAHDDIVAEESELLLILHGSQGEAAALKRELVLHFPVLADETGEVFRKYGAVDESGQSRATVFISDRFGELYDVAAEGKDHELPSLADIMGWLRFIEVQCPECGAPEWPRQVHSREFPL